MANALNAIYTLVQRPNTELREAERKSLNRINSQGDKLEDYIKDAFANTFEIDTAQERLIRHSNIFSWSGNTSNPPDFMLYGGDAVEVKKIAGRSSQIQLNSSYPKQKLYASSSMITDACRNSEDWEEKDLLYIIGSVSSSVVNQLWMVYGDCFVASADVYQKLANAISDGITQTGLELSQSNELARVNRVDPLGITALRVRGMWIIAHPERVFRQYVSNVPDSHTLHVIMLKDKYLSFDKTSRTQLEKLIGEKLSITEIHIPVPDNPANVLQAVYISGVL